MKHRFYEKESISRIWKLGLFVLAVTIAAEFFIHLHAYFDQAEWFAFNAVFGFVACLIMVLFAKVLGYIVKRKEDYYDDE